MTNISSAALPEDPVATRLATVLLAIALLNLNGFSYMLLGIPQVFSVFLLVCSLWLFVRSPRLIMDAQLTLFFLAIGSYLFFGMLFIPLFKAPDAELGRIFDIFSTLLLVVSLASHIQQFQDTDRLRRFLRYVRNLTVISALATLASPVLYQVYVNPPPSFESRSAGLFANPNEAGLMCVMAYIMVSLLPFRRVPLQYAILALITVSALATFSRTAILAILLIMIVSVFQARLWVRLVVIPIVLSLIVVIATDPMMLVDMIKRQEVVELDVQQVARLQTSVLAATGRIDSETSNSRTDMMGISIAKALGNFPFGYGLGTFHHIRGGIMGDEEWLGSHNFFLMVWGEAGFLTFMLFIALVVTMLVRGVRSVDPWTSIFLTLLFIVSAMTSHDTLSARFINVIIALILGLSIGVGRVEPKRVTRMGYA